MITFIDEKGTEHSALVAYSVTNAVNGELSVKGTIYTNDKVLHGIGRGWRFRLDDEYYRITYAKPNDTGRQIEVEFDAVHQFFYDMSKSMVYTTLNGSKPFETYLQAIFLGSGYTYNLETTVGSIRKENFGNKSRISLFNDIIKAAGLEFSVRGHVVRILKRVGTDLSAIVRKNFNMNELKIEKNINSFVTYQRGLGAWKNDEDHSKGRYESEYESPLAKIYGRIEAEPVVDERYKETGKLLERLKENVDKSYKVSVEIDMEDLSRAGYRLSRPNPGDYIMAINETLGFRQKVRIVSFTSEYDVGGNLISRKVVCNDIGTVQRATSEISHLSRTLTDSIEGSERALRTATKALVSADGKNTNYFGDVKPLDVPKGTLRKGDRLFLTVGDKKQLYFWNGAEWELEPTEFDHEKFDMEFNRKSQEIKKTIQENRQKAEEALRNAGASSMLAQEAKRIGLDSIARLEAFKSQATSAQTALSGNLDTLKRTIANDIRPKQAQVETEIAKQVEALVQTKKELAGVKSAQATYEETTTRRLAELTNLANGKASKSELTQTAGELASRIASVRVGGVNLFKGSRDFSGSWANAVYWTRETEKYKGLTVMSRAGTWLGLSQPFEAKKGETYTFSFYIKSNVERDQANVYFVHNSASPQARVSLNVSSMVISNEWQRLSSTLKVEESGFILPRIERFNADNRVYVAGLKLERGTIATDYSENPEDVDGRVSAVESSFKQRADSLEVGVSSLREGLKTKADSSTLTVLSDSIKQSVKSLETDTQNKLNSKLSTAEFDVRASGIRQEIVNATKDKADKALVTAEAGRLREELASQVGSGRNLWINSKIAGNPVAEALPAGHITGQKQCYKLTNNQELSFNIEPDFSSRLFRKVTFSAWVKYENVVKGVNAWNGFNCFKHYLFLKNSQTGATSSASYLTMATLDGTSDWKRIVFTYDYSANKGYDQLKTLLKFNLEGVRSGTAWITGIQVEFGSVATEYASATEDVEGLITEVKATFERTAQGLRTDLSAIQTYINKDGQRQEALQRYSREESAKQATAVRELVAREYVGKSTYQEDVRGFERRFEAITNPKNGSIATQIANYKQSVDGRFTDITSLISGKANQADFQRVKETSQLYERILGNTDNGIANNVARMAMTSQLFQVEVAKASASGRNLFLNSLFKRDLRDKYSTYKLFDDVSQTKGQLAVSIDSENQFRGVNTLKIVSTFSGKTDNQKITFAIGGNGRTGRVDELKNKSARFSFWAKSTVNNTNFQARAGYRGAVKGVSLTTDWQFFDIEFIRNENSNATSELILHVFSNATVWIAFPKVEFGTVSTPFSEAPEDTDEAIRSVQSQLAGSWSVQNINSAGDLISGLNLGANGHNRLDGKLTHITGETLIDKAVIKSAMVDKLKTANFEAGSVTTVVLDAEAVTAEKLKVDQAFFNKLVANEAYLSQLFAKQAFINRVQSVAIDASQVRSGILSGDRIYGGTIRGANIFGGTLTGHTKIQLGSYGSFDALDGGLQINVPRDYNAKDGLGVQFIGSYGRGENVPYGLFLYRDSDFTIGNTATDTDEFLMTVQGYINAKGIGWLKTGKGSVNGKTTGTIGLWNSDNVSLSFGGSGNDIYYSYNSTAYSLWSVVNQHFSDRRLKENIVDCKHKALDYIQQFQFKEYDWKKQEDRPQQAHTKIGLIAQEVQEVDPTLVYENGDTLNLDNLRLTNIALKAIQELALENKTLTRRLENLENERRTA